MITVESISKEFPDKILFKNLSFRLNENMRLGLVGPNGSGKSTLLKILLGSESPDQGKVNTSHSTSIGYLPQEIMAGNNNTIMDETLAGFLMENAQVYFDDKLNEVGKGA